MAYTPIQNPPWSERDGLKSGAPAKRIMADDFNIEFNNIAAEFGRVQTELDFLKASSGAIVASCKYNARDPNEDGAPPGTPLPYTHNVANVDIPSPAAGATGGQFGSCRVTFTKPIEGFDRHYTCLIQPYATSNQHVIATVTNQQDDFVEWTWLVYDGADNTWKLPTRKLGFSFMAVDYEQK